MDKQNGACTYKGIAVSHKKEWSTNICHNRGEAWIHYIKWKQPDKKGHTFYDSIYSSQIYRNRKHISDYQGLEEGENVEWLLKDIGFPFFSLVLWLKYALELLWVLSHSIMNILKTIKL